MNQHKAHVYTSVMCASIDEWSNKQGLTSHLIHSKSFPTSHSSE